MYTNQAKRGVKRYKKAKARKKGRAAIFAVVALILAAVGVSQKNIGQLEQAVDNILDAYETTVDAETSQAVGDGGKQRYLQAVPRQMMRYQKHQIVKHRQQMAAARLRLETAVILPQFHPARKSARAQRSTWILRLSRPIPGSHMPL